MSIIDFLIKLLNNKLELSVPIFSLAYTTEEVSSEKFVNRTKAHICNNSASLGVGGKPACCVNSFPYLNVYLFHEFPRIFFKCTTDIHMNIPSYVITQKLCSYTSNIVKYSFSCVTQKPALSHS